MPSRGHLRLHFVGIGPPRANVPESGFGGEAQFLKSVGETGKTAWIVLDRLSLEQARQQALAAVDGRGPARGILSPNIRTLRQTADAVLGQAPRIARPLTGLQKRQLILRLLTNAERAGRLPHFGRAHRLTRVAEQVDRAFTEIAHHAPRDEQGRLKWASPTVEPADRELAFLLHVYQQALEEHSLVDAEGRLAMATNLLRGNQPGPLAGFETVLASGFRVLTRLERGLLAAIGQHAKRLVVTLPWPRGRALPDVTQPPADDAASPWHAVHRMAFELAEEFGQVQTTVEDQPDAPPDANAQANTQAVRVRDWLFTDPRSAPDFAAEEVAHQRQRYAILSAEGAQDEFRCVANRVKQALLEGVPAEEILLASRSVATIAGRAEQAFRDAGVPLAVQRTPTLSDSPWFRTLITLVRLAVQDWPRAELLSLVTNPSLTLFDQIESGDGISRQRILATGFAGPRAACEWILRELQLASGKNDWLSQLRSLASLLSESTRGDDLSSQPQPTDRHAYRRRVAATVAAGSLNLLAAEFDQWNKAAPLVWFDRLQRTSRELGYQSLGDPATAERDLSAISTLEAAFNELERMAAWQERKTDKLSTAEVLTLLETSLRETPIDLATNDEGRVRLVSVETARRLHPRRLFLVGMTEQSFPAPRPTSAVGHLQPSVDDHHSREMLLFYELVMSASEQVVFSYPTIDNAGQPLSPSSYVSEIERLLAPASIREARLPSPTPTTLAELRSRAVDDLHQGEGRYLKKALSLQAPGGESLAAGLRVSIARSTGDHFGVAEGMLAGRVAKQQLATRFNPEHLWSPTQLETYAACPFKFFLRQVLGIDEPAEFDLKVDYRRRGSLLHDAMVHLHSRLSEAGDALAEIAKIDNSEFVQAFRDAVSAAQASIPESPQQAALVEIEATQATRWGEGYQAQLQKFTDKDDTSGKMRPAYFETRFGPPRNGELLTPPSRPEPFELEIDGETILLTGQVDRIDLGEVDGELVFNVVDYKTAKSVTASGVELREGRQLQLFLYTLATEQHLLADQGARPWRLGYWAVREKGFQPPTEDRKTLLPTEVSEGRVVATEQWEEYGQAVRKRIAEIVRGVRQGDFPMLNPNEECGRNCEFRTTCRVTQTRRLGKTLPGEADADSEGDQQEAPT